MIAPAHPGQVARRPGHVVALTAILLVFLTGMVAFSIDTGYIATTRTQLQRTADAAAHAAAFKLVGPNLTTTSAVQAAVRAEARNYASMAGNDGLTLLDSDIEVLKYDPTRPSGSRLSAPATRADINAVRVRVRKDASANNSLNLFFAPVFGQSTADVRAEAVAVIQPARGFQQGGKAIIPFAVPENYYYSAMNQPLRPEEDQPAPPPGAVQDAMKYNPSGPPYVSNTGDGQKEMLLYSSYQTAEGNYGSIDLGSTSNGTPDLERQLLTGLSLQDLAMLDTTMTARTSLPTSQGGGAAYADVVVSNRLQLPSALMPSAAPPAAAGPTSGVWITGDPGISTAVKDEFSSIIGQWRVIPLYAGEVEESGNNATYRIVKFVPVWIMSSNFGGNPKTVWVQPVNSNNPVFDPYATSEGTGQIIPNLYTSPKLSVP
jgi:hypothetical protein